MKLAVAIPGDLATPTGGYAYDRRIVAELTRRGFAIEVIGLGEGFPQARDDVRLAAVATVAARARDCPVVVDGLALGVLPELAARPRGRLIGLVHHPLALETGLPAAAAAALAASERLALSGAAHVIATSATTARLLVADYGVPPGRLTVAPPGTDRVPLAHGSRDGVPALIAVGSLVPRKGYDVLVAALATIADLPWRLTVVGDATRDPATAAAIAADVARRGMADRIVLAGAVGADQLAALYRAADLFVLASRFEGYGMAYAEAIAYGLPVVGTRAGAIPDTVGSAAVLVGPDDVPALGEALRALVGDRDRRAHMAAAARAAAAGLPTWDDAADLVARAVEAVGAQAPEGAQAPRVVVT